MLLYLAVYAFIDERFEAGNGNKYVCERERETGLVSQIAEIGSLTPTRS